MTVSKYKIKTVNEIVNIYIDTHEKEEMIVYDNARCLKELLLYETQEQLDIYLLTARQMQYEFEKNKSNS